jgi:hypothetical protein
VASDERSFTPDDAGLRIGQANGTSSAEPGVVSPEVLFAGAGSAEDMAMEDITVTARHNWICRESTRPARPPAAINRIERPFW